MTEIIDFIAKDLVFSNKSMNCQTIGITPAVIFFVNKRYHKTSRFKYVLKSNEATSKAIFNIKYHIQIHT